MSNYPNYKPGMNCKGLVSRTEGDQLPTTPRGKRRAENRPSSNKHVCEFVRTTNDRNDNETLYRCECKNSGKFPGQRGTIRGGGKRKGCGATRKSV